MGRAATPVSAAALATAGAMDQARIEGRGNEEFRPEGGRVAGIGAGSDVGHFLAGERCNGAHGGELHRFVNGAGTTIQRATEDVGEAQDIVDLVGEVRTAGADHGVRAGGACHVRHDFRRRIGQSHDERALGHVLKVFRLQHACRRQAEKDVGTGNHLGQRTHRRVLAIGLLPAVHFLVPAPEGDAVAVGDPYVVTAGAQFDKQVEAGKGGRAGARCHDLDIRQPLSCQFQSVEHGGGHDDGGTMLVIMENGNAHAFLQRLFHLEAFGGLDILQVDAAKGRFQRLDGADHPLHVGRIDLDVEDIDAGEFLEQDGLAFHDRLGGQRADIAQPQNGRPVRHDTDEV